MIGGNIPAWIKASVCSVGPAVRLDNTQRLSFFMCLCIDWRYDIIAATSAPLCIAWVPYSSGPLTTLPVELEKAVKIISIYYSTNTPFYHNMSLYCRFPHDVGCISNTRGQWMGRCSASKGYPVLLSEVFSRKGTPDNCLVQKYIQIKLGQSWTQTILIWIVRFQLISIPTPN